MSEQEFEVYLRLLGKLLRLTPRQQADVADELRDHLEARLDELAQSGLSREAAVHRALDEFGDAASLADHFTQIARQRKRRIAMRCTVGTAAAAAVVLILASMFGPQHGGAPVAPPDITAAENETAKKPVAAPQADVATSSTTVSRIAAASGLSEQDLAVRSKLESTKMEVSFLDTHLSDVLHFVSDAVAVDIYMPTQEFADQLSTAVTMQFRHGQLSARAVLELALRQAQLTFTVRDGIVVVCHPDSLTETRVYDCAELKLPDRQVEESLGGFGGGDLSDEKEPKLVTQTGVETLAEIIPSIVKPDAWKINGGNAGDVAAWGTLLVVRATPEMQREIELLLGQLAAPKVVGR